MSFFKRLDKFRKPGESDRQFARRIGCKHQQISMWRKADSSIMSPGGSSPDIRTITTIAGSLGVDRDWLQWG